MCFVLQFVELSLSRVQTKRIHVPTARGNDPVWNKGVLFVAAEGSEELLHVTVKDRVNSKVSQNSAPSN